jgi:hypothetical protein
LRPVKKTRIRKKAKGLGIVHCTGRDEEDASGRQLRDGPLVSFARRTRTPDQSYF